MTLLRAIAVSWLPDALLRGVLISASDGADTVYHSRIDGLLLPR